MEKMFLAENESDIAEPIDTFHKNFSFSFLIYKIYTTIKTYRLNIYLCNIYNCLMSQIIICSQNEQACDRFCGEVKDKQTDNQRCCARCRDGTACLNRAKEGIFCWKHKRRGAEVISISTLYSIKSD